MNRIGVQHQPETTPSVEGFTLCQLVATPRPLQLVDNPQLVATRRPQLVDKCQEPPLPP